MFYKSNHLSKEVKTKFKEEQAPEFIFELFQKVKPLSSRYALGLILDKEHDDAIIQPVIIESSSKNKKRSIITIMGPSNSKFDKGYGNLDLFRDEFHDDYSKMKEAQKRDKYELMEVSEERFKECFDFNQQALKEAKELVSDFHNVQKTIAIQDKYGSNYKLVMVENSDTTIGDYLLVDEAILFNENNVEIGYLRTKYITDVIIKKFLKGDDTDLNPKKIEDLKKGMFFDVAGVDYSSLDEECQNKGLGKQMYAEMALFLNDKNLHFRGSSLQSAEAKRLWEGLVKSYPDNVVKQTFRKNECYFFNTPGFNKKLFSDEDLENEQKKDRKKKTMKFI